MVFSTYVKNQTDEICKEAIKQNIRSLKYVKNQTNEICMEAVKQNCDALQYVNSNKINSKMYFAIKPFINY